LSGGGGDGPSGAECGRGAENRADVTGVLDSGENDDERRTCAAGSGKQIFDLCLTGNHKRGDALRMLGVGNAFEQAISGLENGEGHFRACNERREFFAMAFAGFA